MKLTIALATFNGAKYLQTQLDSFIAQTRRPDELVVCDDLSSDDTLEILKKYQRIAPFDVHIYQNELNLGVVRNFEKAISLCTGDVILLSDQDDLWLPEKLQMVEKVFSENPGVLLVLNDCWLCDNSLNQSQFTMYGQVKALGLRDEAYAHGCCMALRRELVRIALPIPEIEKGHDAWLGLIAQTLDVSLLIPEPLQYYRRHDSNASQWFGTKLGPLGHKDMIEVCAAENPAKRHEKLMLRLELLEGRIESTASEVLDSMGISDRIHPSLEKLAQKQSAVKCRLNVFRFGRLRRIFPALAMFVRGQYSYFSGWKSLAKDLLLARDREGQVQ